MRDDAPPPTFSSRRDRLTYLVGRFRWALVALVIAAMAGVIYWQPELPTIPRWVGPVILANLMLGLPGLLAGRKFAEWLRNLRWVHVYEIDGLRGTREKWLVPPETWREKTVEDVPPNPVNDREDWEVISFEWEEDVEELRVSGTWPGEAKTGELVAERTYYEEMHNTLLDGYRELKQLRAKWHRMATDLEGKVINEQAEAVERGTQLDPDATAEVYEEAKEFADEDPLSDLPDLEHTPAGEPVDEPQPVADGGE
jgi:hypothetical protein